MSNKNQLKELFKHIQIGLDKCSLKELNEAMISVISTKYDKSYEIDYVLKVVCEHYQTTPQKIKEKNVRGIYNECKQLIYCILHFNLGLSIRYIADNVFSNNHMSVYFGIKKYKSLDTNLKQDRLFMDNYNNLSQKIIEYFTKQKELA